MGQRRPGPGGDGSSQEVNRGTGVVPSATARSFPAVPASLSPARAWTCEQASCRGWSAAGDAIELLVGELAGNALRHTAAGVFVVRVQALESLEVAVYDNATQTPVPRQVGEWDEDGRGLVLVAALADAWGTRVLPDGKWVWFELGWHRAHPA